MKIPFIVQAQVMYHAVTLLPSVRRLLLIMVAAIFVGFFIGVGVAGDYRTIVTYQRMDGETARVLVSPGADHLVVRTRSKIVCEDRIHSDTDISVASALWFYRNRI